MTGSTLKAATFPIDRSGPKLLRLKLNARVSTEGGLDPEKSYVTGLHLGGKIRFYLTNGTEDEAMTLSPIQSKILTEFLESLGMVGIIDVVE